MSDIVSSLQTERESVKAVRELSVPDHRQAYSDRTAFIMACAAELAYLKFNEVISGAEKKYFKAAVDQLVDETRVEKVRTLLSTVLYDPEEQRQRLHDGLGMLDLELEATFDRVGTQAILVSCDDFLVLAFRGTEATSVKDIKADAKAASVEAKTEGRVHSGFDEAFMAVHHEIQQCLDSSAYAGKPLFITGHSLGGALATIAAKRLKHSGGIAACYTFGGPRVGDEDWVAWMKTPLYRIVNAADCVTMLPPGAMFVDGLAWVISFVPGYGDIARAWVLRKLGGYMHGGNMRYLTHCATGHYSKVRLLYSVSILARIKGLVIKGLPWKKFLADHSMSIYRKKLMVVAQARNQAAGIK